MAKGSRTRIPGAGAPSKRSASSKAQMPGVPGAPKKVSVSRATNVKKGFRVPGKTARGK